MTCLCGNSCAAKVPIFQGLEPCHLAPFNKILTTRTVAQGELICSQGDEARYLFIISTGRVKLFRLSPSGKEQVIRLLAPGDFFGEVVLFGNQTLGASAQALEETSLCLLEKSQAEQVVKNHPDIAHRLIRALGERLQQTEEQIEYLGTRTTLERVAALLLDLAETQDSLTLQLPLSREGLASLTGMTTENFSRKLSELQQQGLIKTKGQKTIIVLDLNHLRGII